MSTAFVLAAIFDVAALLVIAPCSATGKPAVPDTPAELAEEEVAATAIGDPVTRLAASRAAGPVHGPGTCPPRTRRLGRPSGRRRG